jgi:hypothetical protein
MCISHKGAIMTPEKVHAIVVRWMRHVLHEKGWSAGQWANLARTAPSNITRVMNPPDDRLIIPNMVTVAQLAAVAGSQPDLLRGGRKPVSLVPAPPRRRPMPFRLQA